MIDPIPYESSFQEYTKDLSKWAPDGIIDIDLSLLHGLGILTAQEEGQEELTNPESEYYFHIFETYEKITLINPKYVIWIVPAMVNESPTTYLMIAHNSLPRPGLELVASASGVYNNSKLILKILEGFLKEIEENQDDLKHLASDE
jgi:hypothetical protein